MRKGRTHSEAFMFGIDRISHVIPIGHNTILLLAAFSLFSGPSPAAETTPPPAAPLAPAPAGQYKVDPAHASLELRVSHMGFSTFTTRFNRFEAALTFDPSNIPASKVITTIDASSIELESWPKQCVDILKGPQLLNTEKFPHIEFKSERIKMTGPKTMQIYGTLSVLGVSRPIVLESTFNGGYAGMANLDPYARIGFSAHGTLKRSEFGMSFGIPAAGTSVGVGDSIDVSIEAEFVGPPLAH
jgi:polyisoprenoid-binding protein YceI